MKLSAVKAALTQIEKVIFQLPSGDLVPTHFHVTEVGKITKDFIDCGGTRRQEEVVNFQLWTADDIDHRLEPQKLLDIISLSEQILGIGDHEVEVEYQADTIGKYNLDFDGSKLILTNKHTDCLAKDDCGIPSLETEHTTAAFQDISACTPGSGCC